MKKRYFYLADINSTFAVTPMTKKEIISIGQELKNLCAFISDDQTISGYTKDGRFFYYDNSNFDSFKKSDIINAISVIYSDESGDYYFGGFDINEWGVANPTEDGTIIIADHDNIKEVESADYSETEATAEEPAADQEPEEETATLKNYDEVRETLIETIADLETRKNRYQTDIYLYIDENGHGTIDTFANVGGNSWLNDDHIKIYTDREHCETKLDDLQNGDGRGAWNWLIDELENTYNLTGIKEKIYNFCCDDDEEEPSFKSFDDLEPYDIEKTLYALYCDEIDSYYRDYFIPDCCMDYISEYADQALEEYR